MIINKTNIIYRGASYIWRNTLLKWYREYRDNKRERYWQEHEKHFGNENADQVFYIIRRRDCYCGLFSLFLTNLQKIDDALKAGYIPVVDMQNNFNIYLQEDKIGRENAWEYYFKQPCGYSLRDIQKSKNVIIGSGATPEMFPFSNFDFLLGRTGELEHWRELAKKYMKLSDRAAERVESEYERLFPKSGKVLGVIARGTDYIAEKPSRHRIQPSIDQIVSKAEEIFAEKHCAKIFLATEDKRYYEAFQERFQDLLITNTKKYAEYRVGGIGKQLYEDMDDSYENGMEYLVTIMLLSKCNYLCGGCVSGTVGALLLTEGYEDIYLFDLGRYQ